MEEIYDWYAELKKQMKIFLLGKSLFREVHRFTKEELIALRLSDAQWENLVRNEMRIKLANYILVNQHGATITHPTDDGGIEYETTLLVMKIEDFKIAVEAAIILIPVDKIREIKAGKDLKK